MRIANHARFPILSILTILLAAVFIAAHAAAAADSERNTAAGQRIELSLREAVNLAIENNLGVEVGRHAPLIAGQDIHLAWSAYDPTLAGDLTYSNTREGEFSAGPFSSDASATAGTASIGGLIPYIGASLTAEYSGSRNRSAGAATSYDPENNSGFALKANVPLLKGLVWNEPWTQVEIANTVHASTLEDFRKVLMDTVRDTVSSYWSLVAQEEQLRVAEKSLQTATALLEQTQTQYEVGVKAKVEVIQAEAGVAARELDVIRADAAYLNTQDGLIDAVFGVRLTPNARPKIRPTDKPSNFDDYDVDPALATELAMQSRPELAALQLEIDRRETLVRFNKNQRLPQLDLNVTYGTAGVEGKGNPDAFGGAPPDTGGGYADTHDQWFRKRGGREYSVGGRFSIPLGNYGPRHSVSKARLELRRAKTQLLQLHQQIILEIRRDVRLLEAARKGIDASERQRIAAEEQLRAERIRLEHGESTPFDVLQKESDLVEAEVAKIEALHLYRTSASDLDRAQGTILRTHNILVGSVGELRNGLDAETFALDDLLEPITP